MARRFTKNDPNSALTSTLGKVSSKGDTSILVGGQWAGYAVVLPGQPALVTEIEPDDTEEPGASVFISRLTTEQFTPAAQSVVASEAYGTGDGTTVTFAHTAAHPPPSVNTVVLKDAGVTVATDDGLGHLTGVYASTISGEAYGTGDGATVTFTHTAAHLPLKPGSVTVTAGAVTGTDDGNGHITGTGISAGTVNYTTGAMSVTFAVAPANLLAITTGYQVPNSVTGTINYVTGAMSATFAVAPISGHALTVAYTQDPVITVVGPLPDATKIQVLKNTTPLVHGTGAGKWQRGSKTTIVLGTGANGSDLYSIIYGVSP